MKAIQTVMRVYSDVVFTVKTVGEEFPVKTTEEFPVETSEENFNIFDYFGSLKYLFTNAGRRDDDCNGGN